MSVELMDHRDPDYEEASSRTEDLKALVSDILSVHFGLNSENRILMSSAVAAMVDTTAFVFYSATVLAGMTEEGMDKCLGEIKLRVDGMTQAYRAKKSN